MNITHSTTRSKEEPMDKISPGDKYIIEVSQVYTPESPTSLYKDGLSFAPAKLYRFAGFKSLVFDDEGIAKLRKYEPKPDVSIPKIVSDTQSELFYAIKEASKMSGSELNDCFCAGGCTNTITLADVLEHSTPKSFLESFKKWICKGDEVKDKLTAEVGVVISVEDSDIAVMMDNGKVKMYRGSSDLVKTGNHLMVTISTTTSASTVFAASSTDVKN